MDYDEYDALLEEPFGEDVDWDAIDLVSQTQTQIDPPSTSTIQNTSFTLLNESQVDTLASNDMIIISSSPQLSSSNHASKSPMKDQTNTDPSSPCKCEKPKRVKKKKYLRAIEDILECIICFNTIAAAYSLSCGHTACGICLYKWLEEDKGNTTCFVCREPPNGMFVPNFSIDRLAEIYFKNKSNMDEAEKEEYRQWQSRAEYGRRKIKAKQSKRANPKQSTGRPPSGGRERRDGAVVTNPNPPPPPHNASGRNLRTRARSRRNAPTVAVSSRPEIITEDIIEVVPY